MALSLLSDNDDMEMYRKSGITGESSGYSKVELSKSQKKIRAKAKRAKKARRKNR